MASSQEKTAAHAVRNSPIHGRGVFALKAHS